MRAPGPSGASLNAVSATSPKDAWAVGSYDNGAGFRSLIEHWDGTSWKVVTSPNVASGTHTTNTLGGVVALSKKNAWAVGFYEKTTTTFRTLIMHWDGLTWSVVRSPNTGRGENTLGAIAAVSAKDIWAVGYKNGPGPRKTLVEHWNGSKWMIVTSPNQGRAGTENLLFAVGFSSAGHGWLVGYESRSFSRTLAIQRAGGGWALAPTVSPGDGDRFLQAVAAPSDQHALAVGSYLTGQQTRTLAETWTGGGWALAPSASPGADYNSLQAIAARTAKYAWAVGAKRAHLGARFRTLIELWNGSQWTAVSSPSPGRGDDWLFGAAAVPGNGGFWAVGTAGPHPLIERYC